MLNKAILLASAFRLPAGGGGSFAPDDIAGLVLWLDADDAATITKDGSNNVSQWNDKSGNGDHAVQATAARQPLYVASGINGKGAIDFRNDDHFELPDLVGISGSQNRSALVVFEHFIAAEQGYLIALGYFSSIIAGAAWRFGINASGYLQLEIVGTDYASSLAPSTAPAQAAAILSGSTIGDHTLYLDGTAEPVSGSSAVNTGSGEASVSQQNRGGPGGLVTNKAIDGYISEILIYDSALANSDRQKVEGYLAHKWGITGSLPGGHPFKSSPP